MALMPRRRRTGGYTPALLVFAGVACVFQLSSLSPLFCGGGVPAGGADAGGAAVSTDVADKAERIEKTKAFYGSSRFLKVLLSNEDMHHLGNVRGLTEIEEKTGASTRTSRKGEYYTFAQRPLFSASKILILAGEEQAVLQAFKTVRKTLTDANPRRRHFGFLVPTSAQGVLIGIEGQKIAESRKDTNATIHLRGTPFAETQVITGSTSPEAVDQVAEWLLEEQKDYIEEMRRMLMTNYEGRGINSFESTIYVALTNNQVSQLIGKGGEMKKTFGRLFRVSISIDRETRGPGGTTIVKITGLTGDVHAAHREILERFVQGRGPQRGGAPEEEEEEEAISEDISVKVTESAAA